MYFGIGWHKTATTSLTEAFNLIGLKGQHHPYKMYEEFMAGAKRFKAFGDNKFLCDAIIHVIYRDIDRHYPGSKFIMTTRSEESWLASVRRHFERGHTPRADLGGLSWWDYNNDARHVHAIHEFMYGRRTFDETTMRLRFALHEAGVREYFKDRPDDLLIMDIEDSESFNWPNLCTFIGRPIPAINFPHLRKAAESQQYFYIGRPEVPAPIQL